MQHGGLYVVLARCILLVLSIKIVRSGSGSFKCYIIYVVSVGAAVYTD
jgi:hypothetical protein